jgi:hypothetical protein
MNHTRLVIQAALLTAFCTGFTPLIEGQHSDIRINGKVKDLRQRPLDGAVLHFSQEQLSITVCSDDGGGYSVQLPVRTFLVSVEAQGLCSNTKRVSVPYELNSFSLDFFLIDCSDCDLRNIDLNEPQIGLREQATQENPIDLSKFKYRVESIGGGQSTPGGPIIYFGTRRTDGNSVVYGGISCPGWPQQKPTILAYQHYVLKAGRISYSTKSHAIEADHDVVVFDDIGTKRFSFVKALTVDGELRLIQTK